MKTHFFIFTLLLSLAMPSALFAGAEYPGHHWQPNELTQFNMTATFSVRINGVIQRRTDLELGVFAGDICRSSYHFVKSPFVDQYISEGYNIQGENGEVLTFRLYDYTLNQELNYVCTNVLEWVANSNIGNAIHPEVLDFVTSSASYYTLVSDESQLVVGRQYLITNGYSGTTKVAGYYNARNGERYAVNVSASDRRVYAEPSLNASDQSSVYQFTLGGEAESWTLYDLANEGYLTLGRRGALDVDATLSDMAKWNITVNPDGAVQLKINDGDDWFMQYNNHYDSFYCGENESTLYLLAKCELLNGSMETLTITDPAQMFVVASGDVLTVNNLTTVTPSNLIIEDGAQLINASANVQATVQKGIVRYEDVEVADGFYTIASPMVAATFAAGSNLIWNDYDLYRFDETDLCHMEWKNYKNDEFDGYVAGSGYLYANNNTFAPCFKGNLNNSSVDINLTYTDSRAELTGFNLIGNPYSHNIKKGTDCAIDDSRLASGYYILDHSGVWTACTDSQVIAPCQGILVETNGAGSLTINKVVAAAETRKENGNSQIAITVTDGTYSDRAFVCMNEGFGLDKIQHFNAEAPLVYVKQDGNNFAVANFQKNEMTEIPVCFHAAHNGKYSIMVEAQSDDCESFTLVDNLTGEMIESRDGKCGMTFSANSSDYASRFKVIYKSKETQEGLGNDSFCLYSDGNLLISQFDGIAVLQLVDMNGRIVRTEMVNGSYSKSLNLPSGVYVVCLGEKSQKIVVR